MQTAPTWMAEGVEGADGTREGQRPHNLQGGIEKQPGQVASTARPNSKMSWVRLCLGLVQQQTPEQGPRRASQAVPLLHSPPQQELSAAAPQVPPRWPFRNGQLSLLFSLLFQPESSCHSAQTLVPDKSRVCLTP